MESTTIQEIIDIQDQAQLQTGAIETLKNLLKEKTQHLASLMVLNNDELFRRRDLYKANIALGVVVPSKESESLQADLATAEEARLSIEET